MSLSKLLQREVYSSGRDGEMGEGCDTGGQSISREVMDVGTGSHWFRCARKEETMQLLPWTPVLEA